MVKVNADKPSAVLRFWRDTEIFNIPCAPLQKDGNQSVRVAYLSGDEKLPWQSGHRGSLVAPSADKDWVHAVYIGVASAKQWSEILLQAINPTERLQEDDLQRISGYGWLGAFVVTSSGEAVANSFVPAGFAMGIARLRTNKTLDGLNIDIKNTSEAFKSRRGDASSAGMERQTSSVGVTVTAASRACTVSTSSAVTWCELRDELACALEPLGDLVGKIKFSFVIKSTLRNRRKDDDTAKLDPEIEFLNSFYLDDLDRLIAQADSDRAFGCGLSSYLGSASSANHRRDTLVQHCAMTECVSPGQMTIGRWPAPKSHHLMLAQQAAVGEICGQLHSRAGLIAVNGPPGTGKTTLLQDVIADVIVQRAKALAALADPQDAFAAKTMVGGMCVYPMRPDIVAGTGIVVTSNNDAAVKNITQELPAWEKIAHAEHPSAGYFADVAQHVFESASISKPAWGLIAGALGSKENRRKFANALFNPQAPKNAYVPGTPSDIKSVLNHQGDKNAIQAPWHQSKQEFLSALEQVEKYRSRLAMGEHAMLDLHRAEGQARELENQCNLLTVEHESALAQCDVLIRHARTAFDTAQSASIKAAVHEQKMRCDAQIASQRLIEVETKNPPRIWDRWLRAIGVETARMRQKMASIHAAGAQRADCAALWRDAIDGQEQAASYTVEAQKQLLQTEQAKRDEDAKWSKEVDRINHCATQAINKVQQYQEYLTKLRCEGSTIPDQNFFAQSAQKRHLASAWVTPAFDELRAKLFLAGLRLHEMTLLACNEKAVANLCAVHAMLTGKLPEPIKEDRRNVLWNALFFTVPVVSTTLASFDRLFGKLGQEDVGWLLIDEAGQATPQSVVGALWRSKRAVIIGDPFQVEPVMTVPNAVVTRLCDRHGVAVCWSPMQASAQTVADRTMTLGAYIGTASTPDNGVWTGLPLRAHRRCIDPMFGVANKIAYCDQMVLANAAPPNIDCLLGDSAWIDVRGQSAVGPVVSDEMHVLYDLLDLFKSRWPTHGKDRKRSSVFVISPFKKVAQECDIVIRDAQLFHKEQPTACGTVHRFQGREAEVVCIVLGSAPGNAGGGSRSWASLKPNILNVALTRAKLRVFVIGNALDWGECPGFKTLLDAFQSRGRVLDPTTLFNDAFLKLSSDGAQEKVATDLH